MASDCISSWSLLILLLFNGVIPLLSYDWFTPKHMIAFSLIALNCKLLTDHQSVTLQGCQSCGQCITYYHKMAKQLLNYWTNYVLTHFAFMSLNIFHFKHLFYIYLSREHKNNNNKNKTKQKTNKKKTNKKNNNNNNKQKNYKKKQKKKKKQQQK